MGAGALRVVVNGSGRNNQIADRHRSLQKQSRRVALFGVPVALVGLTFQIISMVKDDNDSTWWIVLIVLLVAILMVLWLLRRQTLRAVRVPGRLWQSVGAVFVGPYDEGDLGLPGSAEFADRHTRRPLLAPVVRLVLTGSTFEIVPASGKNQPMSVPLESISEVAIARGQPKANGVTFTTRTGRVATFLMKPNEGLDAQLERLGATVSRV